MTEYKAEDYQRVLDMLPDGYDPIIRSALTLAASPKALLDAMTDEQRMELFCDYCTECGSKDPRCQCWNDE